MLACCWAYWPFCSSEGSETQVVAVSRFRGYPLHLLPRSGSLKQIRLGFASPQESNMDATTLLIILIVLLVLGGGGYWGRRRWF